jgi:hypothetical protein
VNLRFAAYWFGLVFALALSLFCSVSGAQTLTPHQTVTLGNQTYVVQRRLGQGGWKTAYLLRRVPCAQNCEVVVGVYGGKDYAEHSPHRTDSAMQTLLSRRRGPFLRRESRAERLSVDGNSYTVSVAEFAPYEVGKVRALLAADPHALRILAEQLHGAIQTLSRDRLIHVDIKPSNLYYTGSAYPTGQSIRSGNAYLLAADFDVILSQDQLLYQSEGTQEYLPPELMYVTEEIPAEVTPESARWAASLTIWEIYTGQHLYYDPEVRRLLNVREGALPLLIPENVTALQAYVRAYLNYEIQSRRRVALHTQAEELGWIRDWIIQGLAWRPEERFMRLRPPPEHRNARKLRAHAIRRHFGQRMQNWLRILGDSACPPTLGDTLPFLDPDS